MAIRNQQGFRISNEVQNLTPQCKIVVYNWFRRNLDPDATIVQDGALAGATRLDVSSQIKAMTYTKNISQPTGTFQFTLSNSPGEVNGNKSGDWKDIIKRGDWCVIYLSQDGDLALNPVVGRPLSGSNKKEEAKKIRCIGFIDRVSVKSTVDDNGAFSVEYQVTGRDFGVVYEDTSIWHNTFQFEQIMLQSLANNELNINRTKSLNTVLDTVHDLFFFPSNLKGAKVNDNKSLTTIALQWLMPQQLITDIYGFDVAGSKLYWGQLPGIKNFSNTEAALAVERPTDYLSGNAWEQLRKISVPQFHELFCETTNEGRPQLTFRPIPFAIDKSKYPLLAGTITLFKDLDATQVPSIDLVDFDLGEDNHSRYNSFLVTVSSSLINTQDNISVLQNSRFPFFNQLSIKRFGFRPMHVTVDSIIKNAQQDNAKSDRRLLIEFNELLKDYWENYVFSESGSINKIGRNDTKIGKAMTFAQDVPYMNNRRYYIEGYSDVFEVGDIEKGEVLWMQEVMLTRGFEEEDLNNPDNLKFETRQTEFAHTDEFTPHGSGKNK